MSAKTTVAVEQYLRMGFDGPDCEFVDGEIVERNVGEKPHSKAQVRLIPLLDRLRGGAPLYIHTELRLQLASSRYRIPDICVFAGEEPGKTSHPQRRLRPSRSSHGMTGTQRSFRNLRSTASGAFLISGWPTLG